MARRGSHHGCSRDSARALLGGLARAGVHRLVVVGGAGSLEVAPGLRNVDRPDFPDAHKPDALAQADGLEVYRAADGPVDWTYLSPPALLEPGERTGSYRTGSDQLLVDEEGNSHLDGGLRDRAPRRGREPPPRPPALPPSPPRSPP